MLLAQWSFGKSLEAAVVALPLFAGVSNSSSYLRFFFPKLI